MYYLPPGLLMPSYAINTAQDLADPSDPPVSSQSARSSLEPALLPSGALLAQIQAAPPPRSYEAHSLTLHSTEPRGATAPAHTSPQPFSPRPDCPPIKREADTHPSTFKIFPPAPSSPARSEGSNTHSTSPWVAPPPPAHHAMPPPLPREAPLRTSGAPRAMRAMMGVFRLDPFAVHDGLHAAVRAGSGFTHFMQAAPSGTQMCWDGTPAGPLRARGTLLEFQVRVRVVFRSRQGSKALIGILF